MDNKRPLIIAGTCFIVSILLIWGYTTVKRKEMTSGFGEEVDVVVAAAAPAGYDHIPEYMILRPEMLKTVRVFKKFRQPQTVSTPEEVIGKAAYVPIYINEQITLTKLVHSDGKPVLDRQVERKMRAVTIQIAPHTGVGRLIRPGNRVDILGIVNYDQNGSTQFEAKTMFQNVLVLATGKNVQNSIPTRVNREALSAIEEKFEQSKRKDLYNTTIDPTTTSRPDDNYATITVQLSTEDAEKMLFLQHTIGDSKIFFTLRNSADMTVARLDTTILDQVLGPDSDYGRSKIKPLPINPAKPKFYDSRGGQPVPIY